MDLIDEVVYDLDIDIPISSSLEKKLGSVLTKGDRLSMKDLLTITMDFSNREKIVKQLMTENKIDKQNKNDYLMDIYKNHLNMSSPLMYYLDELDEETQNNIVETLLAIYLSELKNDVNRQLVKKMLNITTELNSIEDLSNKNKNYYHFKHAYFTSDIDNLKSSGLLFVVPLVCKNSKYLQNIKKVNIQDFKPESTSKINSPTIKMLTNIQQLTPFLYDFFMKDIEYIENLSNVYDKNVSVALNEIINSFNKLAVSTFNEFDMDDIETVSIIFQRASESEKTIITKSLEKLLKENIKDIQDNDKLYMLLNKLANNDKTVDIVKNIEKNIFSKNLIVESENPLKFSINFNWLLKISRLDDNSFMDINEGNLLKDNGFQILNKKSYIDYVVSNNVNSVLEIIDVTETLTKYRKLNTFIDVLNNLNYNATYFYDNNKEGLIDVKADNAKELSFIKECVKSFLFTSNNEMEDFIGSLNEKRIMQNSIKPSSINQRKIKKF